jgi:hypothetical protein
MTYPSFTAGEVLRAADMNAVGLWRVGGGALSGSTVNFAGCFTSDYTDYRIVIDSVSFSASSDLYWRLLSGTTPASSADYGWSVTGLTDASGGTSSAASAQTIGYTGASSNTASLIIAACSLDVYGPQLAQRTFVTSSAVGYASAFYHRTGMSYYNLTNAYNGIQFTTLSANTFTGNVSIYGYRKA